ncbi:MAG: DUF4255 domain-containing protein [Daejeonella sp.]|uniref:DUF4255 domain-containing protein n=1 Tax=Daejeonella sp. JGW-45 TaxID=3034148 RepID=UPI0023EAC213|nr:DUF4255 domain-containing protein [Daejeonella sp. JGW-45]
MIYEALSCLAEEINEYFRIRLKISEDKVVLSAIVNQDGTIAIQGENKILVTLVNIERESIGKSNSGIPGGSVLINKSSALTINLYVLFSAYFSNGNYPEALRFISFIIAYFQQNSVFTRTNTPRLDIDIEKMVFELATISPEQVNNIWGALGAKYMPSVVYKVRMLTFDNNVVREYRPLVTGVDNENNIANN